MLGVTGKLIPIPRALLKATDKGAYKTLKHAALSIRKSAIDSMIEMEGPSRPGTPPHKHTGRLGKSILAAEDEDTKQGWVVGPAYKLVKRGGRPPWLAHMLEFGGTFTRTKKRKGRGRPKQGEAPPPTLTVTYPARPFMQPALQRNLARFHRDWKGAIS